MSFVHLPFPPFLVICDLICWTFYCLVWCLPQFCLISSVNLPPPPPDFVSFLLLLFLLSRLSLFWPDFSVPPYSVVFSLILAPFFMTSFCPISQYLSLSIIYPLFFFILCLATEWKIVWISLSVPLYLPTLLILLLLLTLQYNRHWHVYWVLTLLFSFLPLPMMWVDTCIDTVV